MIIYIILLLLILFASVIFKPNGSRKGKKYFIVFVFGAIYLLNALRSPLVGIDLNEYYAPHFAQFAQIPWNNLQSVTISGDWELGFCAFCKLLTYISTDTQFFIAVSSAIIVLPYGYFIYKNCDDAVFGTFFYVAYNLMFSNMNTIRQAMAVSIVIMGLGALRDKKYLKYTIFVLVAVLFHKSALIALVLVFVDKIRLTPNRLVFLLVLLAAIPVTYSVLFSYLLQIPFLSDSYDIYKSGMHAVGYFNWNSLIQFVVPFAVLMLACIYTKPWKMDEDTLQRPKKFTISGGKIFISKVPNEEYLWSDSIVGFAVYMAAMFRFFVFFAIVVGRLSQFFVPFIMIAFPRALIMMNNTKARRLTKYGMYCILLVYFLYIGFTSGGASYGTVPYVFFNN